MLRHRRKLDKPLRIIVRDSSRELVNRIFTEYPIVIGRSPQCDLPLVTHDFVSRQHVAITIDTGQLVIVDLNSSNGFLFSGQKSKRAPVVPGIDVRIGPLHFEFELLSAIGEVNQPKLVPSSPATLSALRMGKGFEPTVVGATAIKAMPQIPPAPAFDPMNSPEGMTQVAQEIARAEEIQRIAPEESAYEEIDEEDEDPESMQVPAGIPSSPVTSISAPSQWEAEGPTGLQLDSDAALVTHRHEVKQVDHHLGGPSGMGSLMEILGPHPHVSKLTADTRVLESTLTWTDQVYDSKTLFAGSRVTVGSEPEATMYLPTMRRTVNFAYYDGQKTNCFVPQGATVEVRRGSRMFGMTELISANAMVSKNGGYLLRLGDEDQATVELSDDIRLHFRYIPAPRRLAKGKITDATGEIQRSALVSGFIHLFIVLLALFSTPSKPVPKIENVPDRIARLLVAPPPPKPEPTPIPAPTPIPEKPPVVKPKPSPVPPKPEIQKIKEQVRQKIQPKPKPIKMVTNKRIEQINKQLPPPKPEPKPVDVTQLGALGALSALGAKSTPPDKVVAMNINPNAGGAAPNPNLGGVAGVLKTAGGKLSAGGGMTGVKTKGLGYGVGSGYGVAGIQGTAGGRAVAGAVVGNPQLMQVGPTEGLTRAQVMDVVKKYLGKIQSCYERSLLSNPGLAGRVEYEWEITPDGRVTSVRVRKSEMSGGEALNTCVSGVFKGMQFPSAKNGQPTTPNIGFPFGRM